MHSIVIAVYLFEHAAAYRKAEQSGDLQGLSNVELRMKSVGELRIRLPSRAVPPNSAKVILNTIRRLELPQDFSGTTTASSLVTPKCSSDDRPVDARTEPSV